MGKTKQYKRILVSMVLFVASQAAANGRSWVPISKEYAAYCRTTVKQVYADWEPFGLPTERRTQIQVHVSKNGDLSQPRIDQSCGSTVVDLSCLECVSTCGPFPSIPLRGLLPPVEVRKLGQPSDYLPTDEEQIFQFASADAIKPLRHCRSEFLKTHLSVDADNVFIFHAIPIEAARRSPSLASIVHNQHNMRAIARADIAKPLFSNWCMEWSNFFRGHKKPTESAVIAEEKLCDQRFDLLFQKVADP